MKPANEQIQDLILLQSHGVEKYKTNLQKEYRARFNIILKKVRNLIKSNYDPENTTKRAERVLLKQVKDTLTSEMNALKARLYKEVEKFTKDSTQLYGDQLTAIFEPVKDYIDINFPDDETVLKGFNNDHLTFEKGDHTVASIWATFFASLMAIINSAIQQAYNLEQSEQDFEDNLFGAGGVIGTSNNHLASVIAVLVTHGYNTGLKYEDLANTKVVSGYIYLAIMDSATTPICASYNDKVYFYGHPELSTLPYEVYPGLHYRCRSSTAAITKSYTELGINPEDLTPQQKELLSGELPQAESYSQFFNKQPKSVQKEILGPARYDLFSRGEITVDKFFTRDGRRLTLDELMKKGYDISGQYLRYVRKT